MRVEKRRVWYSPVLPYYTIEPTMKNSNKAYHPTISHCLVYCVLIRSFFMFPVIFVKDNDTMEHGRTILYF